MAAEDRRVSFLHLADGLFAACRADETLLLSYYGEDSDFVRISQSRIRQAGRVTQRELRLTLIRGLRNVEASCNLSGDPGADLARLAGLLADLRMLLDVVPEDPYLRYADSGTVTVRNAPCSLPDAAAALAQTLELAAQVDLVGLWASGDQYYGFANNLGLQHWHATGSFNLDASVHLKNGQAVKVNHAGSHWLPDQLEQRLTQALRCADLLAASPRSLPAGSYRTFLAPAALAELLQVVRYSGFSRRAVATRRSPLAAMYRGERRLHEQVFISEARGAGLLPRFSDAGFVLPESVNLVSAGVAAELLTDRRSAAEYAASVNADTEMARSITVKGGAIPRDQVLQQLDTGLYISNLWYTNLSELQYCRITGSTRFACFWVENGRVQAPLATTRFDDSLYDLLGDRLLGLTDTCDYILDPGTYGARSGTSLRLPGIMLDNMRFVM